MLNYTPFDILSIKITVWRHNGWMDAKKTQTNANNYMDFVLTTAKAVQDGHLLYIHIFIIQEFDYNI